MTYNMSMSAPNRELDEIRRITDPVPADAAPEAPPMVCPACGTEMTTEGICPNEACDN